MANRIEPIRVQRELRARFNMDESTPVPNLAPEILPVVAVDDLDPLYCFPAGIGQYAAYLGPAAVAGEYSYVEIVNPANSGWIAKVNADVSYLSQVQAVGMGWASTTLTATLTQQTAIYSLDARENLACPARAATPLQVWSGTDASAALVSVFRAVRIPTVSTSVPAIQNLVMVPGTYFALRADAVNMALYVNFHWVQRKIEGAED